MGAEVGLGEGDGERGVGREVEGGRSFAPVPVIDISLTGNWTFRERCGS